MMVDNDVKIMNLKQFIMDSGQENWNVLKKIYGNGNFIVCMEDHEHTCLFHWFSNLSNYLELHKITIAISTQTNMQGF